MEGADNGPRAPGLREAWKTAARTRTRRAPNRQIAGAIAEERHRVRVQRRRHDFANLAWLDRPTVFADDLDEPVVVANVISVVARTLPGEQRRVTCRYHVNPWDPEPEAGAG